MKKVFIYLILSFIMIGCSDVLDTIPTDRLSTELYWQSDKDAEYAANAIYRYLEDPQSLLAVMQCLILHVQLSRLRMKRRLKPALPTR
jgi:hypothetical protein